MRVVLEEIFINTTQISQGTITISRRFFVASSINTTQISQGTITNLPI